MRFRTDEWLFRINDRLVAPNTDATFAGVKAELEAFAGQLFGGAPFELGRVGNPRQPFSVRIKGGNARVAAVLDRLGGAPRPDGTAPA